MDKVRQLLGTDEARTALYEFLSDRAAEQGATVEELVVRVIEQYIERTEEEEEETKVFRMRPDSRPKQEALRRIESCFRTASFHQGAILEIARLIPGASHNVDAIAHCADLASRFGYHTRPLIEIAQLAARGEYECPELSALAELAVRKLSNTAQIVELAEQATRPLSPAAREVLAAQIEHLEADADFATLDEALQSQREESGGSPSRDQA